MQMKEAEWDTFSRGSAIRRARRSGFRRNVAIALGNWKSREAVPPLIDALADDEPLVRAHAAWALGQIRSPEALEALRAQIALESQSWVREEIEQALADQSDVVSLNLKNMEDAHDSGSQRGHWQGAVQGTAELHLQDSASEPLAAEGQSHR
jgi:hypothetical protein